MTQQPVGDGMEGAGVDPASGLGAHQVAETADQLLGCSPAEGDQQDALGRHPGLDEPGQAGHQGPGLARTRPGRDEQRGPVVLHRGELHRVQAGGPGGNRRLGVAHGRPA